VQHRSFPKWILEQHEGVIFYFFINTLRNACGIDGKSGQPRFMFLGFPCPEIIMDKAGDAMEFS
jgi:hypothetical protein